jgi:NAD(P)-dependent dehydrogenase (short-subunit alcohol dehydrogenase family)
MNQSPSAALAGKVVVVIGGTGGIGLCACRAILHAGGRVISVGPDEESVSHARAALGSGAQVIQGDARELATAATAIQKAMEAHGRFDALYHVAGGSGRRFGDGPLHELTDEGWQKTLDWNLTSVMYSNRAAVQQFLAQGGGAVLNLSSVLAHHPGPRHFATSAYTASKAAIEGVTRSWAAYYAPHKIRFNALAPGLVRTPMSRRAQESPEVLAYAAARQPLSERGMINPEGLDAAAVFLLSDAARYVTGQAMTVDAGWSISDAFKS